MQFVRLILITLFLSTAGCDSARISQLETENLQLKNTIAAHDKEASVELAKWELAASTYNGCISVYGVGSTLCPESALIHGEIAVLHGLVGADSRYWLILMAKIIVLLSTFGLIVFACWSMYIKIIKPDQLKILEAIKLVNEAESKVQLAKNEEISLMMTLIEIEKKIENLKEIENKENSALQAILRKKQEAEIMSKAMKAFDS